MTRTKTTHIVIHCAATRPSQDIDIATIRKWHVEERKWTDVGYHYVLPRNGNIQPGRKLDAVGAHVEGHNATSVGICLVGGLDEHGAPSAAYTEAQWRSLKALVHALTIQYPEAQVCGHRDFPGVTKACPSFDVRTWFAREVISQTTE